MFPAFLITLRETLEASLITSAILVILIKFKQLKAVKTVWLAVFAACIASFGALILASLLGFKIQEIYTGKTEEFIEGIFMITSAIFITWAVFFLHKTFANFKKDIIKKITKKAQQEENTGIFWLTFTVVFREGFEIILFLSTIFFSSKPIDVFSGFLAGILSGLIIALTIIITTIRLPIAATFKIVNLLLIFFACGLLARGLHEFEVAGIIPQMTKINLIFLPGDGTLTAQIIKTIFGLTRQMNFLQIATYASYFFVLYWAVFIKKSPEKKI